MNPKIAVVKAPAPIISPTTDSGPVVGIATVAVEPVLLVFVLPVDLVLPVDWLEEPALVLLPELD